MYSRCNVTTAIDERIKSLYENEQLSPEEIAKEEGFNLIAVKAKLMQISSLYRKDSGKEPLANDELNFSDAELKEVNQIIMDTARAAETSDGAIDWRVRLKAAFYIRDDKKGRKEVKQALSTTNFNILSLNDKLSEIGERTKKMKELVEV